MVVTNKLKVLCYDHNLRRLWEQDLQVRHTLGRGGSGGARGLWERAVLLPCPMPHVLTLLLSTAASSHCLALAFVPLRGRSLGPGAVCPLSTSESHAMRR